MEKPEAKGPLEVLQWLFENQSKLPKDPTALLKHVGWVFATRAGLPSNLRGNGYGLMSEMFSELTERDGHNMSGDFTYRENPPVMHSTTNSYQASQQPGWHFARLLQLYHHSDYQGGMFVFTYTMPPPKGHVPPDAPHPSVRTVPMTDLNWNRHREPIVWDPVCQHELVFQKFSFDEYIATFELNGVRMYLMESEDSDNTFLALGSGSQPSQKFGCAGVANWNLEFVEFDRDLLRTSFVHGFYNANTRVASSTKMHPDTLTIRHSLRRFPREQAGLPPRQEARVFITDWGGLTVSHRLDCIIHNDNSGYLSVKDGAHHVGDLVRSMDYIASLVTMTSQWTRKSLHINYALTEAMRSRIFRIAYKFLLIMGEKAELRRAADPVRKCAACAVQAVKSQLALGIEGPSRSKRQRT